jgi:PHS family inorganic phosphate transporter-like MFS transporter
MNQQSHLAVALSSFGLMADIYDFQVINLVRPTLEQLYGQMTPREDGLLTAAALGGAIAGQLTFGAVADRIGRRVTFIVTAALVAIGSLGSALSTGPNIYFVLAIWRFIMGLGIGGEYPLAAASTMENVQPEHSSMALAVTFSGMALGQILAPSVVLFLSGPLELQPERLWRSTFGIGALLALLCTVARFFLLRETMGWQRSSRDIRDSQASLSSSGENGSGDASHSVRALKAMSWSLLGTAGSWFLYDIITYGVGLFTTTIFRTEAGVQSAWTVLIINVGSAPGFFVAIYLAGLFRMRNLLIGGLAVMMVAFGLLARMTPKNLLTSSYMWIFIIQANFDHGGPGVATFCIPGQIYPTRLRATAHGMSAAFGKLGAVVGALVFPYIYARAGIKAVMVFMASMSAATIFWTWLFVPSYGPEQLEKIDMLGGSAITEQAEAAERELWLSEVERDKTSKGESEIDSMYSPERDANNYGSTK